MIEQILIAVFLLIFCGMIIHICQMYMKVRRSKDKINKFLSSYSKEKTGE